MKILETAVVAERAALLDELAAELPLEKERILDIDVYRMEIDEDLVILMYHLAGEQKISLEIVAHLQEHLGAFLVVADNSGGNGFFPDAEAAEELARLLEGRPTVVAVKTEAGALKSLNEDIRSAGFFLAEKGRVMFWNTASPASRRQVWNTLWQALQS